MVLAFIPLHVASSAPCRKASLQPIYNITHSREEEKQGAAKRKQESKKKRKGAVKRGEWSN